MSDNLTVQEAAQELGIGTRTAWRWIKTGRLFAVHMGGHPGMTVVPRSALTKVVRPTKGPKPKGSSSGQPQAPSVPPISGGEAGK